ncbi:hypothetical protein ACWC10_04635 [Streptomyces sp. NPDC001595]|uniref:hypothetical protein n=1 Tax=Streptomyces sp. NPDC001532 TaxID=3154520 RepID=UPI00332C9BA3
MSDPEPDAPRLPGALRARVRAFDSDDDPRHVLDPEAVREAEAVARYAHEVRAAGERRLFLESAAALAEFHWRHGHLTEDTAEAQRSVRWFTELYRADPRYVPAEIRRIIVSARGAPLDWYLTLAQDLLDHADRVALDEAVHLARSAVLVAGAEARSRGAALRVLAAALTHRFDVLRDRTDIDEAAAVGKEAVSMVERGGGPLLTLLGNLTATLSMRFDVSGDTADLEAAAAAGHRALALTDSAPAPSPTSTLPPTSDANDLAGVQANLATVHSRLYWRTGDPGELDEAIELARAAVRTGPRHPEAGGHRYNLALFLLRRYRRTRLSADLGEAVVAGRQAVAVTASGHYEWPAYAALAARLLSLRAWRTASRTDAVEARSLAEAVLDALPPEHPDGPGLRSLCRTVGDSMTRWLDQPREAALDELMADVGDAARRALARGQRSGDATEIASAVSSLTHVTEALPPGHPAMAGYLASLASGLLLQYERVGDPQALDEALVQSRAALELTGADDPDLSDRWATYAHALRLRLQDAEDRAAEDRAAEDGGPHDGGPHDGGSHDGDAGVDARLDEAVTALRAAVGAARNPEDAARLGNNLAVLLRSRSRRRGDLAMLDEAIARGRRAVEAGLPDAFHRPTRLANLATSLLHRHLRRPGAADDLDEAVALAEEAASSVPDGHIFAQKIHAECAAVFTVRYEARGRADDLERLVRHRRAALRCTPPGHPSRSDNARFLALALHTAYRASPEPATAYEALDLAREALTALTAGSAPRPAAGHARSAAARHEELVELLAGLLALVIRDGDDDPAHGLSRMWAILELTRHGHPRYAEAFDVLEVTAALANELHAGFLAGGDPGLLDEAAELLRSALDGTAADDPRTFPCRVALCGVLGSRFDARGDAADLEEALAVFDRRALPAEGLSGFALALLRRHRLTGAGPDIDTAIEVFRLELGHLRGARSGPEPEQSDVRRELIACLTHLGSALRERHESTGRVADLDEAVEHCRQALALDPDHPVLLSNLGGALRRRSEPAGDQDGLDEAIGLLRRAAERAPTAQTWFNLAMAHVVRLDVTSDDGDYTAARTHLQASVGADGPATARLRAAQQWARLALSRGDFPSALAASEAAAALLPLVAWRGLSRDGQETVLAELSWWAADAAAAAVSAGRPERALELLEDGRAVMWSQLLQLRSDLELLHATAPELAARLHEIRHALEEAEG